MVPLPSTLPQRHCRIRGTPNWLVGMRPLKCLLLTTNGHKCSRSSDCDPVSHRSLIDCSHGSFQRRIPSGLHVAIVRPLESKARKVPPSGIESGVFCDAAQSQITAAPILRRSLRPPGVRLGEGEIRESRNPQRW